jgi:hypothetical protein
VCGNGVKQRKRGNSSERQRDARETVSVFLSHRPSRSRRRGLFFATSHWSTTRREISGATYFGAPARVKETCFTFLFWTAPAPRVTGAFAPHPRSTPLEPWSPRTAESRACPRRTPTSLAAAVVGRANPPTVLPCSARETLTLGLEFWPKKGTLQLPTDELRGDEPGHGAAAPVG